MKKEDYYTRNKTNKRMVEVLKMEDHYMDKAPKKNKIIQYMDKVLNK